MNAFLILAAMALPIAPPVDDTGLVEPVNQPVSWHCDQIAKTWAGYGAKVDRDVTTPIGGCADLVVSQEVAFEVAFARDWDDAVGRCLANAESLDLQPGLILLTNGEQDMESIANATAAVALTEIQFSAMDVKETSRDDYPDWPYSPANKPAASVTASSGCQCGDLCQCGDNCKCQMGELVEMDDLPPEIREKFLNPKTAQATGATPSNTLIVYTESWCTPCQIWKEHWEEKLVKLGWRIKYRSQLGPDQRIPTFEYQGHQLIGYDEKAPFTNWLNGIINGKTPVNQPAMPAQQTVIPQSYYSVPVYQQPAFYGSCANGNCR